MKAKMMYECDFCGFGHESKEVVEEHEAAHYGLTAQEYKTWRELDARVKLCSHVYEYNHNRDTEAELEAAVDAVLKFEAVHNLSGRRCFLHG